MAEMVAQGHTVNRKSEMGNWGGPLKYQKWKLDETCISSCKLEISDWTAAGTRFAVQFEISSLQLEMQDSSNFHFFKTLGLEGVSPRIGLEFSSCSNIVLRGSVLAHFSPWS
jgi:hypothetical protein